MNKRYRRTFTLLTVFSMLTIFCLLTITAENQTEVRGVSNYIPEKHENSKRYHWEFSQINLYNLTFSTKGLISLDPEREFNKLKELINHERFFNNIVANDQLYDIWLWTELRKDIGEVLNVKAREKVIQYVKDLRDKNEFYRINMKDSGHKELYQLHSTKMALDILEFYDEIPDLKFLENLLPEMLNELKDISSTKDFISYGGYLLHIKSLDDFYFKQKQKYIINEEKYSDIFDMIIDKYHKEPNSIMKFDTAIQLNEAFVRDLIKIDKNVVKDFLISSQLDDGSFPLGNSSDVLTTYLAINVIHKLNIHIPHLYELQSYMNDIHQNYSGIN